MLLHCAILNFNMNRLGLLVYIVQQNDKCYFVGWGLHQGPGPRKLQRVVTTHFHVALDYWTQRAQRILFSYIYQQCVFECRLLRYGGKVMPRLGHFILSNFGPGFLCINSLGLGFNSQPIRSFILWSFFWFLFFFFLRISQFVNPPPKLVARPSGRHFQQLYCAYFFIHTKIESIYVPNIPIMVIYQAQGRNIP